MREIIVPCKATRAFLKHEKEHEFVLSDNINTIVDKHDYGNL